MKCFRACDWGWPSKGPSASVAKRLNRILLSFDFMAHIVLVASFVRLGVYIALLLISCFVHLFCTDEELKELFDEVVDPDLSEENTYDSL